MKKYRPSCGTEGADFQEYFCDRCEYDKEYRETLEKGCPIIAKTFELNIDDPDYPKEWCWKNGKPVCTKFKEEIKGEK